MIWGLTLEPGRLYSEVIDDELQLSMASLESRKDFGQNEGNFSHIVMKTCNAEYLLCTLVNGLSYQQNLDLKIMPREKVSFTVLGSSTVYLMGYTTTYPDESSGSQVEEEAGMSPADWQPYVSEEEELTENDEMVHHQSTESISLEGTVQREYNLTDLPPPQGESPRPSSQIRAEDNEVADTSRAASQGPEDGGELKTEVAMEASEVAMEASELVFPVADLDVTVKEEQFSPSGNTSGQEFSSPSMLPQQQSSSGGSNQQLDQSQLQASSPEFNTPGVSSWSVDPKMLPTSNNERYESGSDIEERVEGALESGSRSLDTYQNNRTMNQSSAALSLPSTSTFQQSSKKRQHPYETPSSSFASTSKIQRHATSGGRSVKLLPSVSGVGTSYPGGSRNPKSVTLPQTVPNVAIPGMAQGGYPSSIEISVSANQGASISSHPTMSVGTGGQIIPRGNPSVSSGMKDAGGAGPSNINTENTQRPSFWKCSSCGKLYEWNLLISHDCPGRSKSRNVVRRLPSTSTGPALTSLHCCKVCNKSYVIKRSYLRHIKCHFLSKEHNCHVCGKEFYRADTLQRHLKIHMK